MTDLIVDFPRCLRIDEETTRRPPPAATVRGHVRISATSELTITAPVTEEQLTRLWYTKRERDRHKRALKRDALRLVLRLETAPPASLEREELYECVGMEAFLSLDVLQQTKRHKIGHVRTILAAQERQRTSNIRDEEELSRLSQKSSAPAAARAQKLAAGYWRALNGSHGEESRRTGSLR